MSFALDVPSTEDVLAAVLDSPLSPLAPQEQHLGATEVSWWETHPGEVYIHAEGGTADDRHYASVLTMLELEAHGYRRTHFDLDDEHPDSRRTSSWVDVMSKAKRLIQSGQVHMLRNGFNNLMGHVIGDHGEYDTEISRDDPNSRAITGWQCSCPWDQYAWQRTRKWKKFEGRPCAHILATYWKALATPMDEDLTPEQAEAMGTGQAIHAPAVPEHPPEIEERIMKGEKPPPEHLPRSFGPEGILPGDQMQMNMPPDAIGGPPGPAQAPLAPPPGQGPQPPGILPPFPGEQQQIPWGGPGTTPGGGVSPPEAISVPGAKPPTPFNPIQGPGTYSKVANYEPDFEAPEAGEAIKVPDPTGEYPDGVLGGWRQHHDALVQQAMHTWKGAPTEFGLFQNSSPDPKWNRTAWERYLQAQALQWEMTHRGRTNDVPLYRGSQRDPGGYAPWSEDPDTAKAFAGDHGQVHTLEQGQGRGLRLGDYINCGLDDVEREWIIDHDSPQNPDGDSFYNLSKVAAEFNAPQVVRLKNPMMGLAEGPVKGQYGDGEYREVPAGSTGEVLSQDATTGWVEVIVPLDDSGPHEPFHVRCFTEPADLEPTGQSNAFIKRHTKMAKTEDELRQMEHQLNYGACGGLALALHDETGWPLVKVTDAHGVYDANHEPFLGRPAEERAAMIGEVGMGIGGHHWLVQRPDGKLVDSLGAHDPGEVWNRYEGEGDVNGEVAMGYANRDDAHDEYVDAKGEPIPVAELREYVPAVLQRAQSA